MGIASLFTASLGKNIGEAIISHDWSSVGEALASSVGNAVQGLLGNMGPFGGFVGGIFGGLISGLGGLFGGGGSSDRGRTRGDSITNPLYTQDVNTQRLLTELLNASKVDILRSGAGEGSADAALDLQRQARLAGAASAA